MLASLYKKIKNTQLPKRINVDEEDNSKPKFLLYTSYSYGLPILRPLQKELIKRDFDVAWFIEQDSCKKNLSESENILHNKAEVLRYSPSIILAAANEVPHFFTGIKVQVFHGFNVSKRSDQKGHFRIRGFFDLYCTQGPSTTKPFEKLAKKQKHFKVIETGWSKMDSLFPLVKNKNKKPVILFASTFTKSLSVAHNKSVFTTINELIKNKKYDWIFTMHPKMDSGIVTKFKKIAADNAIPFVEGYENLDHLKNADVLLTDTSSIITEFIIQQKPVITFNNRIPKPHLLNIKNANKIERAIEIALNRPATLMQHIKEFTASEHPYFDGKSSVRVIDASLKFFNSREILNLKSKPLNWIRKYKINKRIT